MWWQVHASLVHNYFRCVFVLTLWTLDTWLFLPSTSASILSCCVNRCSMLTPLWCTDIGDSRHTRMLSWSSCGEDAWQQLPGCPCGTCCTCRHTQHTHCFLWLLGIFPGNADRHSSNAEVVPPHEIPGVGPDFGSHQQVWDTTRRQSCWMFWTSSWPLWGL